MSQSSTSLSIQYGGGSQLSKTSNKVFILCAQGKNVLRKEPMSREIDEGDTFHFNESFQSKFYKVSKPRMHLALKYMPYK